MSICATKRTNWKRSYRAKLLTSCKGEEQIVQLITSQIDWEEYIDTIFEHTRNFDDTPDIRGLNTKVTLPDGAQILIVAEIGTSPYSIKMFEEGDKVFHTVNLQSA